ncbi:MAG: tyrosine-type recombinase/integrase [Actinomycetota bacterium]|nr:tyrosine-type recombinase/integrase [Actinomycetota bacterium]
MTVKVLRAWLTERRGAPAEPLFPTNTGRTLSRDAIGRRITQHARAAAQACPSLSTNKVSAHTLRHTAAMRLLLSEVDITVIALWLGHEQVATTNIYLHAYMSQKETSPTPVATSSHRGGHL